MTPLPGSRPLTADFVAECLDRLARQGYREAITAAMSIDERQAFIECGFDVHEHLHLLSRPVGPFDREARRPPIPLRRGFRAYRRAILDLDHRAFGEFWRLDEMSFAEALTATPAVRFRVAGTRPLAGYAITGLAGPIGYLQRVAVHPHRQRQGIGQALVADALQWLANRGASRAVVNTQVGNQNALKLYESMGFRLEPEGLAVLTARLRGQRSA